MTSSIITQLQQLNFSPNEALVYTALLEIGQTSAGEIIKKTGLHRSVVYETLDKLIKQRLVFKLKKRKISYFQPTDPSCLLQNINAQKELAEELVPKIKMVLQEKLPEITVYQGLESYKQFWLDSVREMPKGSVDYIAGSIGMKWFEYMGKDYDKYLKTQVKRRIKWKMIIFSKEPIELFALKKYPKLNSFRLIDKPFHKQGNFNVFADQSVILHSTTEPMIIQVKNKTLVKVFRNLFDLLWEMGREVRG